MLLTVKLTKQPLRNSLRADFPTKDFADSWAYLSFQDIYDAVEGREKHVVIRIGWYDEDDDGCYRGVYTSNIAVEANFTNVSRYKQIIISAILNIDVRDGSGKQDYYFKFILNEDETVTTEYTRVGGSSDSEAVQEIFYADFDIDLSDFSVTGIRTTYQEIVSQIKAGKYIVGRGIYAMVSSPINIAYFPLSVDLREGDTLIFSGLIQSSYAGKAVILSITLSIDLSNEVYVKVRLVSTTDIV